MVNLNPIANTNWQQLSKSIKIWGKELGFQQIGITDTDLSAHHSSFKDWLANNYHGEMQWIERNLEMRLYPEKLHANTLRIISVRMNYLPNNADFAKTLADPNLAYISRYALGRDYHKLMRKRLKQLAEKIKSECEILDYRPFVDSAPVMERPIAAKAGIGWIGKNGLVISPTNGSWFFLGEILVNIPLPVDKPVENLCGRCVSCVKNCPTKAIIAPYTIDARRCISYLTIEYKGIIPIEFRKAIGNKIYGCDDCQLICPWNKESVLTSESDFLKRDALNNKTLLELFNWSEDQFLDLLQGSPIRRIGYLQWLRNISIALGNAPYSEIIIDNLKQKLGISDLLDHHIIWAISEQKQAQDNYIVSKQRTRLIKFITKAMPRDA